MTADDNPNNGDWSRWSKHVILTMEQVNSSITELRKDIQDLKTAVAILKVKLGIIAGSAGFMGGLIPAAIYWWRNAS